MDPNPEDAIIRTRLATDQRPLKKLVRRFVHVKRAFDLKQNPETCKLALTAFLTDLASFSTGVLDKQTQIQSMNVQQQAEFARDLSEVTKEVETAKNDIARLKIELEEEKNKRVRMLEYDAVARNVLEIQSREDSERNMRVIQQDIESLREKKRRLDDAFALRKLLLRNVVTSVHVMKEAIASSDFATNDPASGSNTSKRPLSQNMSSTSMISLADSEMVVEEGEEGEAFEDNRRKDVADDEEDEEGAYIK
ncbi:THO complex subunit 7 [Entophlyctis luteolus]|nr:THO complex subunit 7 [Entophlyctis luteolus]